MEDLLTRDELVEKLSEIVSMELKELRDTMDFEDCHEFRFNDLDAPLPLLNLTDKDGGYVTWIVKRVTWQDDDIVRIYAFERYGDSGYIKCFNTFEDEEFRSSLVPGEITELTKRIDNDLNSAGSAGILSDRQKELVQNFIQSYNDLQKGNVDIIYDEQNQTAYFINAENIEGVDDQGEERNRIDFSKLQSVDLGVYLFLLSDDSVYAVRK